LDSLLTAVLSNAASRRFENWRTNYFGEIDLRWKLQEIKPQKSEANQNYKVKPLDQLKLQLKPGR